jgi:hypothetical protein
VIFLADFFVVRRAWRILSGGVAIVEPSAGLSTLEGEIVAAVAAVSPCWE